MINYTPQTWQDGSIPHSVTAERMTHIETGIYDAHNPDSVYAYRNASLTVPNDSWTDLILNAGELWDTSDMHSTSSNSQRLIAKTAGEHDIYGKAEFGLSDTGIRGLRLLAIKSGVTSSINRVHYPNAGSSDFTAIAIPGRLLLGVNDYIVMQAYQDSGGNLIVFDYALAMRHVRAN